MDIICDKLLLVAKDKTKTAIYNSLTDLSEIEILEADSENKAFELIYTHNLMLAIVDETIEDIDIYKMGSMLLSHKDTNDIPLLIITDHINPNKFLTDFKALQIDYITKPFEKKLIQAKIKIFFDLFKQKQAVKQSINELDQAYKKIVAQQESVMVEKTLQQELAKKSFIAATQIHQTLPGLKTNIQQLFRYRDLHPKAKSNINAIKTSTENISQISNKLLDFKSNRDDQTYLHPLYSKTHQLLYIQSSNEEFNIFNHCIKNTFPCELIEAKTMEQGIECISQMQVDLIFTDHLLPGATGFDLLSRLKQMRSDIPVIFAITKSQTHIGPQAISKGAFNFFIKEEMTGPTLISVIHSTLQKAKISWEVEDAMNRIVMIARKDALTKLYTPQYFKKMLTSETSKSKRYHATLSILVIHFNIIETIQMPLNDKPDDKPDDKVHNTFLTTSAALIQSMIRESDIACLLKKETFAVILPHTEKNGLKILARRILKKVEATPLKKDARFAVNIGGAVYNSKTDTDTTSLLNKAMDALTCAMSKEGNAINTINN